VESIRGKTLTNPVCGAEVHKCLPQESSSAKETLSFLELRLEMIKTKATVAASGDDHRAKGDVKKLNLLESICCWENVPPQLSGLCAIVLQQLCRRRRFLVEAKASAGAGAGTAVPPLRLDVCMPALQRVGGWVVSQEKGNPRLIKDPQMSEALKKLEGPKLPNTNNFVFKSPQLQHLSLHSAHPALVEYMLA
jgi:hypothetical protein